MSNSRNSKAAPLPSSKVSSGSKEKTLSDAIGGDLNDKDLGQIAGGMCCVESEQCTATSDTGAMGCPG